MTVNDKNYQIIKCFVDLDNPSRITPDDFAEYETAVVKMWTLAETETDPTILGRIQDALNYSDDPTRNLSFSLSNKRPPPPSQDLPRAKQPRKMPHIYVPVVYSNDPDNMQFMFLLDFENNAVKRTGDKIFDAVSTDVVKGFQEFFNEEPQQLNWEVYENTGVLKHPESHIVTNNVDGIPVTAVLVSITKQQAEIVIIAYLNNNT